MAFVNWATTNTGYAGVETSVTLFGEQTPAGLEVLWSTDAVIERGDLGLLRSPVFNSDINVNGWQTYDGGGDCPECPPGGSTRPSTGMIYPRGQG